MPSPAAAATRPAPPTSTTAPGLWRPEGRDVRRWLTDERGLPAEVLRANRIGADLGPRRQPRPDGMPEAPAPCSRSSQDGRAIYAQVRVPHPWTDRPRYLNPAADLAPNPRLARFRPPECDTPK